MRPCGGGSWPKEPELCDGGVKSIGSGASANRALAPWCSWTARTMTGLRAGESAPC